MLRHREKILLLKLFQKFFDKIDVIGNDNNFLQINLVIAIPDDINYFQRKIIEKIFQSQIFPSFIDSNDSSSDNSKKNYKVLEVNLLRLYIYYKLLFLFFRKNLVNLIKENIPLVYMT